MSDKETVNHYDASYSNFDSDALMPSITFQIVTLSFRIGIEY